MWLSYCTHGRLGLDRCRVETTCEPDSGIDNSRLSSAMASRISRATSRIVRQSRQDQQGTRLRVLPQQRFSGYRRDRCTCGLIECGEQIRHWAF
jgi:hypothetical protein